MKIGSFMTGMIAVGMVATPVVAQAGTKASATVFSSVDAGSRASTAVAAKNKVRGSHAALAGAGVIAAGLGLYFAVHDGNKSRG